MCAIGLCRSGCGVKVYLVPPVWPVGWSSSQGALPRGVPSSQGAFPQGVPSSQGILSAHTAMQTAVLLVTHTPQGLPVEH